jgi:hypothetical protein
VLIEGEHRPAAVVLGVSDTDLAVVERDLVAAFDRIAALLAAFDWEHDDRQYALEAIERIVLGGER